jgi:type IV secretory pathway VirB10-like protein
MTEKRSFLGQEAVNEGDISYAESYSSIEPLSGSPSKVLPIVMAIGAVTVAAASYLAWDFFIDRVQDVSNGDPEVRIAEHIQDPPELIAAKGPRLVDETDLYRTDETPEGAGSQKLKEIEALATENGLPVTDIVDSRNRSNALGEAIVKGSGIGGQIPKRSTQSGTSSVSVSKRASSTSQPSPFSEPGEDELMAMFFASPISSGDVTAQGGGNHRGPAANVAQPLPNNVYPDPAITTGLQQQLLDQVMSSQAGSAEPGVVNANEQWAQSRTSSRDVAVAYVTGDRTYVVGEGTVIRVGLRTAVNSQLPGDIQGVVVSDVYADVGRQLIIPRGSVLFGEYQAGSSRGQNRIFAIWQRIRRPDGVEIVIDSNLVDDLGRSGVQADVNHHFFERFAAGAALSVIGNAASNSSASTDSSQIIRNQIAVAIQGATQQTLEDSVNIKNTLSVRQGEVVQVYLNRDLDFSSVMGR